MNVGTSPLRGLSLCTGIGGLELGLHLALNDYRTVCAVEWDKYPQSILVARQQDGTSEPFPIWDDVKTFDGNEWRGRVNILSAGYPCQPFSLAGNRRGTNDPRHLWPHVARIIGEAQPSLVFLENVPGHLSLGFSDVGVELCQLGYRFEAGLFSAAEVGASHNRERLFVLAHAARDRQPRPDSFTGGNGKEPRKSEGPGQQANRYGSVLVNATGGRCREGWPESDVEWWRNSSAEPIGTLAHADDGRCESIGRRGVLDSERATLRNDAYGCDRSLFPPGPSDSDTWRAILADSPDLAPATESAVRRVADGLPRRVDQLKALGNAVVPLVAAHAFRTLTDRLLR